MELDTYLDINKDEIPYAFEVELGGEVFELEINYNAAHDFFTVDLFKGGAPLVIGEMLQLNRPLFRNRTHIDLPKVQLIPKDRSNGAKRITYDNLNEKVFLFVVKEGEVIE